MKRIFNRVSLIVVAATALGAPNAKPVLAAADSQRLVLLAEGGYDYIITSAEATSAAVASDSCEYAMTVTVKNDGPRKAPDARLAAVLLRDSGPVWFAEQRLSGLNPNAEQVFPMSVRMNASCDETVAFLASVEPPARTDPSDWEDRDAQNNHVSVPVKPRP